MLNILKQNPIEEIQTYTQEDVIAYYKNLLATLAESHNLSVSERKSVNVNIGVIILNYPEIHSFL